MRFGLGGYLVLDMTRELVRRADAAGKNDAVWWAIKYRSSATRPVLLSPLLVVAEPFWCTIGVLQARHPGDNTAIIS
jgi:hypothetical protein